MDLDKTANQKFPLVVGDSTSVMKYLRQEIYFIHAKSILSSFYLYASHIPCDSNIMSILLPEPRQINKNEQTKNKRQAA